MNFRFAILAICLTGHGAALAADPSAAAGRAFFENKIRPVLVKHCYECHSADAEKIGGKLLLDTRGGLLKGGESGTPIVAGQPEESLIVHALRWEHDLEMPPETPLSPAVIQDFIRWVEMGAPDPRSGAVKEVAGKSYDQDALWSFQPVSNPEIPPVKAADWALDPLDRFVLAQIEESELAPATDATPEVLIRRLSIDLTGLPPSMPRVQSFVADYRNRGQEAVEQLVDELLGSAHFGERWGRHWLDVARYAESNGNDGLSRNPTFPHAWRYRDYVIAAFNDDTPYDRFLTEQIAGDLLAADSPEERDRNLVATGFLAMAAKPAKAMNTNFDMDVVADQIDVVSTGVMALGVACARCHDHKFDPIPTRDYYALAGLFTNTETMWGLAANEGLTAPKTDLHVLQAAPKVPPPADFVETVLVPDSNTGKPKTPPKSPWAPGTPLAMGVRDRKALTDCKINLKGEASKLGESAPRGFLTACETSQAMEIPVNESGRLQLAKWLTSGEHPQTARVMANRIWLHLFGEGIVRTPDDFGVYGDRPTHPRLLDHLATRFVADGWSVKQLIRSIVLSRTYQLSSEADGKALEADPENRWLARHNRRRLDAESLRDSILKASGQLDSGPGEGSVIRHRDILVNLAGNLHQPSTHRSIYLCYLRNSPPPELAAFDFPDFVSVKGQRDLSTVPGQALFLFNNPLVIEQAGFLAQQLLASDETERVRLAYHRSLNRDPNPEELYRALELVRATESELDSAEKAWASLCQALFASNEFRYID